MKFPLITLTVAFATCALYVFLGAMPELLIWQHGEGQQGWQWLSAHFVHISAEHLVWNTVALLVLGSIVEQNSPTALLFALVAGAIGVNIYLAFFYTLSAYAGLSGVLNTVLVVALYQLYQNPAYKFASVLTFILSVVKVVIEYCFNLSLFSTLPWPSVPQAHLAGLVTGVGLWALGVCQRKCVTGNLTSTGAKLFGRVER
ncbi:rhombosortase [Arenicella chitinivorans]|nr:rhombosortase [Arenicella chitinivorans]